MPPNGTRTKQFVSLDMFGWKLFTVNLRETRFNFPNPPGLENISVMKQRLRTIMQSERWDCGD